MAFVGDKGRSPALMNCVTADFGQQSVASGGLGYLMGERAAKGSGEVFKNRKRVSRHFLDKSCSRCAT